MSGLDKIVDKILTVIVSPAISLLLIAATVVFFFGLIEYLWKSDSEEARSKGKQHMYWGIIGLAVMVSAGAIIVTLCNFFEVTCT